MRFRISRDIGPRIMRLRNLSQAREGLSALHGTLVGVGMTAFPRMIPAYFLDTYGVITLRKTYDLPLLREKMKIFCLQETGGRRQWSHVVRSDQLLACGPVRDHLTSLPGPKHLLVYQGYPSLETMARKRGWRLLANPAGLRLKVGERAFFLQMAHTLELPEVPGAIYPVEALHRRDYAYWSDIYGPKFVVQLPDITQGGGRGTFFIRSGDDYHGLRARLQGRQWRGIDLQEVSIRRFIKGIPASMSLCLTRQGVLMSRLQRQVVDPPYVNGEEEDGIFCGHSWGDEPWTSRTRKLAGVQARRIGDYLWNLGVKGIIGIDFVVRERDQTPYPIEVNPRLTGAFPMISLLHLKNGILPLDLFHLLEFLDLPYRVDVPELNRDYATPLQGSHLLVFRLSGEKQIHGSRVKPGVYELDPHEERFVFVKAAIGYEAIQNRRQFVVIDGPPAPCGPCGAPADPLYRLCHLLFSYPVMDSDGGLSAHARLAARWVHGRLTQGAGP